MGDNARTTVALKRCDSYDPSTVASAVRDALGRLGGIDRFVRPGARVLLIFTYRPEYVHTWGQRSYHHHVHLNRLSGRESLEMVTHLLGARLGSSRTTTRSPTIWRTP